MAVLSLHLLYQLCMVMTASLNYTEENEKHDMVSCLEEKNIIPFPLTSKKSKNISTLELNLS